MRIAIAARLESEQGAPESRARASRLDDLIRFLSELTWDRRARLALLVACVVAMFGLLLYVGRWLTFWFDEWDFIFDRQTLSLDSVFRPHVAGIVATPSLLYQGLLAIFGLQNYQPFLLVTWLVHLCCVVLLYRIVGRRSGPLLGTMAALSLLFLGSAYEVLLQPFQVLYLFAAVGGLLALDRLLLVEGRPDGRHSLAELTIAAIALVFAVASSSLGPIMVGLVVVWALLSRDRQALAATAPAILTYGAWYLTWGGLDHGLPGSLDPIQGLLALLYGLGAAVCGVIGLPPQGLAPVGIVIGVVVAVVLFLARIKPGPLMLAGLAALVAEYGLAAFFRGSLGVAYAARSGYLYPAAIFLWLAISGAVGAGLAETMWRGRGRRGIVPLLIGLLIVPMIVGNMRQFVGASLGSRTFRATELAELRLLEAARDLPGIALDISPDPALIPQVTARDYLAAIDRFGAPTLAWDWTTGVDTAAVNEAALRVLGTSIAIVASEPPTSAAPIAEVTDATTGTGTEPGCVRVAPNDAQASATVDADGRTIWLRDAVPERMSVRVGVLGAPSAVLTGEPGAALLAGRPIAFPELGDGYRWRLTVRSESSTPFEVCAGTAG